MSHQYSVASVRQLAGVVGRVAPRDPALWERREPAPAAAGLRAQVSRARADQLWMVVGMFDRAVGREEMPDRAGRSAAQLFTWRAMQSFWELAVAGELRFRARDVGTPLPLATRRIVRDCLALLGDLVVPGKELWLPSVPMPAPRAVTTRPQEVELFRFLVGMAGVGPMVGDRPRISADARTRLLALTGVALDTRARVGELAAMMVGDLAEGEASVRVRRRQQNGAHLESVEVDLPLSPQTGVALRRWLKVRERAVEGVEGGRQALWVRLAPTSDGAPPGLPLSAQSIARSYMRGVRQLNGAMAGREGWEPLPARLEGLRRAWLPPEEAALLRAREERAEAERERRPVGRPRIESPAPLQHGRERTYNEGGCRCAECREAAVNARRARRHEAAGR